jgi:hypothetical protein
MYFITIKDKRELILYIHVLILEYVIILYIYKLFKVAYVNDLG